MYHTRSRTKFDEGWSDILGTIHKHLGPDAKRGALKIFDPCKGAGEALKKITTNFPVKIKFTCFSTGLTRNSHGKKGALKFFEVWRGEGAKHFRDKIFLHQAILTSVCERSLIAVLHIFGYWYYCTVWVCVCGGVVVVLVGFLRTDL